MKNRLAFLFLLTLMVFAACNSPKVYLVRHAEKSANPPRDPNLTAEGKERAEELAKLLSSKKITAIYSTNYNRTRETAAPLSRQLGLAIQYYNPDTAAEIANLALLQKKNMLIVGHSNTLLPIISALGLSASVKEIPDSVYNHLFVIYPKKGKLKLLESSYGKAVSAANAAGVYKMN